MLVSMEDGAYFEDGQVRGLNEHQEKEVSTSASSTDPRKMFSIWQTG